MLANLKTPAPRTVIAGFIAIVASATLPFLATGAHAAAIDNSDTPRVEVHYGDLDLATVNGRAKLAQRISGAASEVCTTETSRVEYARCRDASIARAKNELAARAATNHFAAR